MTTALHFYVQVIIKDLLTELCCTVFLKNAILNPGGKEIFMMKKGIN
jgi:hypothetical protein